MAEQVTSEVRAEFGAHDPSFTFEHLLDYRDNSWYKYFIDRKCDRLLADRIVQFMSEHQFLDFLVQCRNSLSIGGTIRIGETDWFHTSAGYKNHAAKFGPVRRLNILDLTQALSSVGLVPSPIEFMDQNGTLFEMVPHFNQNGIISRSSRIDPRAEDPELRFSSIIVDGYKVAERLPGRDGYNEKIYAVGDSHVRFLAGRDEGIYVWPGGKYAIEFDGYSSRFTGLHLGPSLAFNLNKYGSATGTREKIEGLISSNVIPKGATVIFSFGEIDCRSHVCAHASKPGNSIHSVVENITRIYARFIDTVCEQGFRVAVWGVPATTWHTETLDINYPIVGSFSERQEAIRHFNKMMRHECRVRSLPFVCIFDQLHDRNGSVERELFCDLLHVSQKARYMIHQMMPDGDFQSTVA